jgi:uncharacterized protein (TIGR00369 family)
MYASAPVNALFKPRLKILQGQAELSIPVRPELFHAAGAVHGSVYFKALDDACFFAVNSLVQDVFVLTANFNIYLTRPVSSGTLKASARVVHQSRALFLAEGELQNSAGRQIARGSGTFMRSTMALSHEVGYA